MTGDLTDTIFALSSGQPPAAIGVIRISGPRAGEVLIALAGRLPEARRAALATICDPSSAEPLDSALILWFPGPKTATGEDLAEIHCHGGRAVTAAIMAVLAQQPQCRLAQPGEYTRRAFENGRIDLNEAEGLADLLFAETETQRRSAMAMADGHFSRRLAEWQSRLLKLSALTEAALDFSDEDDVPDDKVEHQIAIGVAALVELIEEERKRPSAERLRDGVRVVIGGPPNAGKSTLLNALVGRDAAIVSNVPGTTRDRIDAPVSLGGIAFLLTDTAGLRNAEEEVEAIGVRRAQEAIDNADIVLWLGDPAEAPANAFIIIPKADVFGREVRAEHLAVSALSGEGMADLVAQMVERAAHLMPREGEYALHQRQRLALEEFHSQLSEAIGQNDMLIVAELLRRARLALDSLTGRAGTEDMLDALFGTFCIGK